jgi:hypothetical protein
MFKSAAHDDLSDKKRKSADQNCGECSQRDLHKYHGSQDGMRQRVLPTPTHPLLAWFANQIDVEHYLD